MHSKSSVINVIVNIAHVMPSEHATNRIVYHSIRLPEYHIPQVCASQIWKRNFHPLRNSQTRFTLAKIFSIRIKYKSLVWHTFLVTRLIKFNICVVEFHCYVVSPISLRTVYNLIIVYWNFYFWPFVNGQLYALPLYSFLL